MWRGATPELGRMRIDHRARRNIAAVKTTEALDLHAVTDARALVGEGYDGLWQRRGQRT